MENSLIIKRPPGRPVGQSDAMTQEELVKIVSLPDRRTKEGLRDYAVLLVLTNTPMRISELKSLQCGNIIDEGEKKFIAYQGLKKRSKKPYWLKIPIDQNVYDGLVRYIKTEHRTHRPKHDTPLFMTLGKHGPYQKKPITKDAIEYIVKKYAALAGIKKRITAHSFRATYLTLRKHKPAAALIRLSGHKDLKGLSPYIRTNEEETTNAALEYSFS